MAKILGSKTKHYDDNLRAAFDAGVEVAAHASYDSVEAIPQDWVDLKYRAFRDALAGDPWTPERWQVQQDELERRRRMARSQDFGEIMGHPGGHYGN